MVLKQLAQIIMATVRKGDFSARWGGEEFVIVLPETDLNEALNQAERLREAIANEPMLVDGTHLTITTSVGVAGSEGAQFAQRPLAQASLDVLLKCADKALYEAKHNGKNQVATFVPQQHEQSISNSALGMNHELPSVV
jgi:diguanylate cyclase (GGDEF)-like protein